VHGADPGPQSRQLLTKVLCLHRGSFSLDLKIITMTIWKILKREGISQPGHVAAEEFEGSNAEWLVD
jgi:hypothetical protein